MHSLATASVQRAATGPIWCLNDKLQTGGNGPAPACWPQRPVIDRDSASAIDRNGVPALWTGPIDLDALFCT